ncbi:glutamate-5-semialdehyde dehydrogenase [Mesohalobacter halotolerans]|jgi:glutamate-5-semialdehyde dehydrogenase|uniref:Gamma-glutamyl phosphate reductase n=1 Tax=Mesohalobacter halotolerans TaxID=1883405 RepID=A0A4U5TPP9_9FLAO|nr:glutamate-5-semialdehyde dehydrogenase [Mesohalobacter halotolerans]MBS3739126.1 glutamate-5-semialdehyde dehydrogenase [Psychroflexus sp.]NBC59087.1 glutamate-5-semialdehyde dehydrogenase [Bacteroidota bacterium]TKS55862.1 glutamate-5-semialdehyde dehydrogenase [Mesohalobacter halotolerans]
MKLLDTKTKNNVLQSMMNIIEDKRQDIIKANKKDLEAFNRDDQALYDRLVVDDKKVDGMIQAIKEVKEQDDPVGNVISDTTLESGLKIVNKTDPFGTILIIYESRPDVTIEAAVLAFKANNKILLKGGKEAVNSNIILEECWHKALEENGLSKDWIKLMHINRQETQEFLRNPTEKLDLIVPRGGERLIEFVKTHAACAVLISGRGNNFLYISEHANWEKAVKVVVNAKTDKISGCNALDKVLINENLPDFEAKIADLANVMKTHKVEVVTDGKISDILKDKSKIDNEEVWSEEFLALKILISSVKSFDEAVEKINTYSGKHSSVIITEDAEEAAQFMEQIDSAAVYHNASSRFTDGGQMGVGAELAISTDKLHHRGPLGLKQLVTNKYYVYGDGHVRA